MSYGGLGQPQRKANRLVRTAKEKRSLLPELRLDRAEGSSAAFSERVAGAISK